MGVLTGLWRQLHMVDETDDWRDWAQNAWGNIQKRREDERLKSRNFVAEEDRIRRDTPLLWSQFRTAAKAMCEAFNNHAGNDLLIWDSERLHQALIRIEPSSATFSAIFDPEHLRLHLEGKQLNETYSPVVQDGQVVFGNGRTFTPPDLARRFLDSIVKSIP